MSLAPSRTVNSLNDYSNVQRFVVKLINRNTGQTVSEKPLNVKITGVSFIKGWWTFNEGRYSTVKKAMCPSEDVNNNRQLDNGEDVNGNGRLDPVDTASFNYIENGATQVVTEQECERVCWAWDRYGNCERYRTECEDVLQTVELPDNYTNDNGEIFIDVEYFKRNAGWVNVLVEARVTVDSNSCGTVTYNLRAHPNDLTPEMVADPYLSVSPWGESCADLL